MSGQPGLPRRLLHLHRRHHDDPRALPRAPASSPGGLACDARRRVRSRRRRVVRRADGRHPDTGKYRRTRLFVLTLGWSRKSVRLLAWKSGTRIWAELHERAFRRLGGVPCAIVLDNLKEGVLRPDVYEPTLNPVYAALLAHYGVVADPCRVADPNRKGTVENAIQHTQGTALKGRHFESLEAQNDWLAHWEERWAAPRIHGRKKRQVLEMFLEEKEALRQLPVTRFHSFRQARKRVGQGQE